MAGGRERRRRFAPRPVEPLVVDSIEAVGEEDRVDVDARVSLRSRVVRLRESEARNVRVCGE